MLHLLKLYCSVWVILRLFSAFMENIPYRRTNVGIYCFILDRNAVLVATCSCVSQKLMRPDHGLQAGSEYCRINMTRVLLSGESHST